MVRCARRVARLPFGHGLSFTTFAYSALISSSGGVRFNVTNTGAVAGAEVAQLYLGFPASAGEPPQQLKGFARVQLAPGESKTVQLPLAARAFSTWDTTAHEWVVQHGRFTVAVGASSRDIRLTGAIDV